MKINRFLCGVVLGGAIVSTGASAVEISCAWKDCGRDEVFEMKEVGGEYTFYLKLTAASITSNNRTEFGFRNFIRTKFGIASDDTYELEFAIPGGNAANCRFSKDGLGLFSCYSNDTAKEIALKLVNTRTRKEYHASERYFQTTFENIVRRAVDKTSERYSIFAKTGDVAGGSFFSVSLDAASCKIR